jgi:CBS domain containing-hemolysin-like protein
MAAIPLLLFLLACAAIYLGTISTAFSALLRLSLRLLAERTGRSDRLSRFLDDPILLFVPVRLLLGFVVGVATLLLAMLVGADRRGAGVVLVGMGIFVVVCEYLIPMLIVRVNPERVMEILLPSFTVVAKALQPLTVPLIQLLLPRRDRTVTATTAETADETGQVAEAYLEVGEQQGVIERDERRLLQSIFDFGDTLVREVMTPRPDIVAISVTSNLDELKALIREEEYSRIPVFRETLDNIVGIVYIKDLLQVIDAPGRVRTVAEIMRPAYVVPETKRVADLLKEFQVRQVQAAIVLDEYGGTAGLATLEDLLEEIVGEIRDEYDVESEPIVEQGDGTLVVSGKVDVHELEDRLGIHIERQGFETVGGYLLAYVGRVPSTGEVFDVDGLSIEVLEVERRRVNKVRIRRTPAPAEQQMQNVK